MVPYALCSKTNCTVKLTCGRHIDNHVPLAADQEILGVGNPRLTENASCPYFLAREVVAAPAPPPVAEEPAITIVKAAQPGVSTAPVVVVMAPAATSTNEELVAADLAVAVAEAAAQKARDHAAALRHVGH